MSISYGLCQACSFRTMIATRTGSQFVLCERSKNDPSFPKYPRLPVERCAGFVQNAESADKRQKNREQ